MNASPRLRHRILLVLRHAMDPNAGGVQMSTWKMGSWFAGRGHDVAVFSFAQDGHQPPPFGELFDVEEPGEGTHPANLTKLRECLGTFKPDVVIHQTPYEHPIGEVLKQEQDYLLLGVLRNTLFSVKNNLEAYADLGVPSVVKPVLDNRVGRQLLLMRHRRRHRSELEQILSTYDRFVMFGPPNMMELDYFVPGFDRGRIALIPNSIPAVLDEVPVKGKRLLWLGRITNKQKRADLIAPLWERLQPRLPGWELDVVGDGPDRQALEQAIAERGLERVRLHGRQVPDDYYRRAAVFIMTSAFEGFPNTIVEAQSFAAVPVLFDSFPIASWMVHDGTDGALVAPFDVATMADRIVGIIDGGRQSQMMERALDNARQFHIDRVGARWEALFEHCGTTRTNAA